MYDLYAVVIGHHVMTHNNGIMVFIEAVNVSEG